MPKRPNTPCKHPGCGRLVEYGQKYCSEHKRMYTRPADKRGYDSRWQKARKAYLSEHPLCAECMRNGKYVQATVVDHVIPHRGDKKLFWDMTNWQALCKPCHDKKTGRYDSNPVYTY